VIWVSITRITMLLCLSRLSLTGISGVRDGVLLRADKTGMGRSLRRAGSY
jgi:hypothetical protein